MNSHSIQLINQVSDLTVLSDWVARLVPTLGFSEKMFFRVDLVLVEAFTNIIDHAFQESKGRPVTITLQAAPDCLDITIIDHGQKFDLTHDFEVTLPTSLADAGFGGLGVHLIKNYTDRQQYMRQGDQNILTLHFIDYGEQEKAYG